MFKIMRRHVVRRNIVTRSKVILKGQMQKRCRKQFVRTITPSLAGGISNKVAHMLNIMRCCVGGKSQVARSSSYSKVKCKKVSNSTLNGWILNIMRRHVAVKIIFIPRKRSLGGIIGVTRWSVGWSVGRSSGPLHFLVRSITWRLMVGIQYNFIQWSSTLRGSAVHINHNPILTHYRVTALVTFPCPEHNLKTTGWNSKQLHTMVKRNKEKCHAQSHNSILTNYRVIVLCYFSIAFFCPDYNLKTNSWNSI
jgi:hypothetical protein